MKDKIICLVGPSGTGKTTIAKELEKLGYNIIHSYTTREPRERGEWGHIFINKNEFKLEVYKKCIDLKITPCYNVSAIIAFKEIYDQLYFATKEQYQGKGTSIYIVDPDGANEVKENVKDAEVITIFLMTEGNMRFIRMVKRPGENVISEISQRIEKDREIFKTCKCNYVVDANRELEEVVKDVIEIIGGENNA